MENDFKNDFFTKEQLQSLINIPVYEVIRDLDTYIYYEGIVSGIPFDEDPVKVYVVGFIKQTRKPVTHLNRPGYKPIFACSYKCGDNCSRPDLKDVECLSGSIGRWVIASIKKCWAVSEPITANE